MALQYLCKKNLKANIQPHLVAPIAYVKLRNHREQLKIINSFAFVLEDSTTHTEGRCRCK